MRRFSAIIVIGLFLTVITSGCLESEGLITAQAEDVILTEDDFPENWTAYDNGEVVIALCNNSREFQYFPPGEHNEYFSLIRIRIAVYEDDRILENGTVWDPVQQSKWIYEFTKDDQWEKFPIDLGEEGFYHIHNSTVYNGSVPETHYTTAFYGFRMENVWVYLIFYIYSSDIPYWGWFEDMARLQESRIVG